METDSTPPTSQPYRRLTLAKRQTPLTIDDKGFHKILKEIGEEGTIQAGKEALRKVGKSVMKASMKNTPVDLGDVRDSHKLSVKVDDAQVHAEIDVTDEAAYYAHEQLEAEHTGGGQAKFLQQAIKRRKGAFQKQIRLAFSDLIRKKGLDK